MKILVFSLGLKGFTVVKALVESSNTQKIKCIIGVDKGVSNDYSNDLISYCDLHGISHEFREQASYDENSYDLFFAVGWRWIIPDISEKKLIIFHDSLLPRYRGFAPLVNALINREATTGVTALLGANEYDAGNIILQKSLQISYPTDINNEINRISILYAELAIDIISKLNDRTAEIIGTPQNEEEATYSLWRDENDYRINWNDDAKNIAHFISCVSHPYQGASAKLNDKLVRILKARIKEDVKIENRSPGKVIFLEANLPVVVCGIGLLLLEDIRDENCKTLLPLKYFRSRFH